MNSFFSIWKPDPLVTLPTLMATTAQEDSKNEDFINVDWSVKPQDNTVFRDFSYLVM